MDKEIQAFIALPPMEYPGENDVFRFDLKTHFLPCFPDGSQPDRLIAIQVTCRYGVITIHVTGLIAPEEKESISPNKEHVDRDREFRVHKLTSISPKNNIKTEKWFDLNCIGENMETLKEILRDNAQGNEALKKLVGNLATDDLNTPMEAGWTVSAVLAHLAFWDQRAITLIQKWELEGVGDSPIDTDVINEVTRHLCLAVPPEKAAHMAVTVADEIDRVIEGLSPELVEGIRTSGKTVRLNRADHRRTHIVEIERAIQSAGKRQG